MLKNRQVKLIVLFITFLASIPISMQSAVGVKNTVYVSYIENYKFIAISHMKQFKIPASITLAQGLLESGAGKSELALKSNNHFGIKCNTDWKGDKVIAADDTPTDCFRKYTRVDDSYADHARFLAYRDRYVSLFSLDRTDYKSWARGLQKAGYATDKAYANKLIKLIEEYELYLYDKMGAPDKIAKEEMIIQKPSLSKHTVYKTHGLVYILANTNDTFESIATEYQFKVSDLYRYNEVPSGFPLQSGDIVYFQYKKNKVDKPYYEHKVRVGESMHTISQKYGIRLDRLFQMNKKQFGYIPREGDILKLR